MGDCYRLGRADEKNEYLKKHVYPFIVMCCHIAWTKIINVSLINLVTATVNSILCFREFVDFFSLALSLLSLNVCPASMIWWYGKQLLSWCCFWGLFLCPLYHWLKLWICCCSYMVFTIIITNQFTNIIFLCSYCFVIGYCGFICNATLYPDLIKFFLLHFIMVMLILWNKQLLKCILQL